MDIAHGDLYVNHSQEMSEQVLHKNIREIAGSKSVWKMASFMCFNVIPLYRGGSNHYSLSNGISCTIFSLPKIF